MFFVDEPILYIYLHNMWDLTSLGYIFAEITFRSGPSGMEWLRVRARDRLHHTQHTLNMSFFFFLFFTIGTAMIPCFCNIRCVCIQQA